MNVKVIASSKFAHLIIIDSLILLPYCAPTSTSVLFRVAKLHDDDHGADNNVQSFSVNMGDGCNLQQVGYSPDA